MNDVALDPELDAMSKILAALNGLDEVETKKRVLKWAGDKVGIEFAEATAPSKFAGPESGVLEAPPISSQYSDLSINTIAARMNVKSCRDLMGAAAALLAIVSGKDRFTRDEWVEICRAASDWKKDYSNQLPVNTQRMVKSGQLNENQKNVFSLSRNFRKELEDKIAER